MNRRVQTSQKTWRGVAEIANSDVRALLARAGAVEDSDVHGNAEAWRTRLGRAVFTGYSTGTIYCNGGAEPELSFLYLQIDHIVRFRGA